MINIVTWNVNGLRAIMAKDKDGLRDSGRPSAIEQLIEDRKVDILCLQETKCPDDLIVPGLDNKFAFKKIIASKARKV